MKVEKYIDTVSSEELEKELCYENGKIESEWFYYKNKSLHRVDGPTYISYYNDGSIEKELYFLNDIECDILQEMVIRGLEMGKIEN